MEKETRHKEFPEMISVFDLQILLEQAAEEESRRRYPKIWAYFDNLLQERIRKRAGKDENKE